MEITKLRKVTVDFKDREIGILQILLLDYLNLKGYEFVTEITGNKIYFNGKEFDKNAPMNDDTVAMAMELYLSLNSMKIA